MHAVNGTIMCYSGSFSIGLMPIFGPKSQSIRVVSLKVDSFSPNPADIEAGLVVPQALEKYFPILMDWIQDAYNLELNRKVVSLSY